MNLYYRAILDLLGNYSLCGYPLNLYQIHKMLVIQIDRNELNTLLSELVKENKISVDKTEGWYTPYGYEINFRHRRDRKYWTMKKRQKVTKFLQLVYAFPWIDLVLLTGSCAIENAKESDDVDLMLITRPHTMYICRLYTYVLARILGVGRKRLVQDQTDKVCTNIWIDGSDLLIPQSKVNTYSAREIVNAVVLLNRWSVYERLIGANSWISHTLPNWHYDRTYSEFAMPSTAWFVRRVNEYLGYFQLWYMRSHVTQELISMTQLWLHPRLQQ